MEVLLVVVVQRLVGLTRLAETPVRIPAAEVVADLTTIPITKAVTEDPASLL